MMDVRNELLSLRDDSNAEFAASLTPCGHRFLGARIPALRRLAKRIASEDWRGYLEDWNPEYFEDYMLRGLVIAYAKVPVDERLRLYDGFIPLIDNWSVCDSLCTTWKPKKDEKGPLWSYLIECLRRGGEFRMRFAAVMMMSHFLDDGHVDDVLEELDQAQDDGYYFKMGKAWCLATCLAKHPERTMAYLEGDNRLDEETRRMTIRKASESYRVEEDVKSRLRAMRRYRFLSSMPCPCMDKTAKAYVALAIAVPSILTVWCLASGCSQASLLLTTISLFCCYPMICCGLYMWLHGGWYRYLNIGVDWSRMTEEESKSVASGYGPWLAASMALLLFSISILLSSMVLGFVLMAVSIAMVLIPVVRKPRRKERLPLMTPSKRVLAVVLASVIALVPSMYMFDHEGSGSVEISMGEEGMTVKAPMFDRYFSYDDIDDCEYFEDFNKGTRVMGYADGVIASGTFKNDMFGRYQLASYVKVGPCVAISYGGEMYAFNQSSVEETLRLYEDLSSRISMSDRGRGYPLVVEALGIRDGYVLADVQDHAVAGRDSADPGLVLHVLRLRFRPGPNDGHAQMDEDRQLRLHDAFELDRVVGAHVVIDPVSARSRGGEYEHPGSDVLPGDLLGELGVADVRDLSVRRMEGESHVRRVAVPRHVDVDLHPVHVQDVPGPEHYALLRETPVVGGYARPEVAFSLENGRRAVKASAPPPPSVGHPLDHRFRIRVVVRVAVRHDDRFRLRRIVVDLVHLGEGARPGVDVEEPPVVFYEHSARAAHLESGGVPAAPCSQKGDAESHGRASDARYIAFFTRILDRINVETIMTGDQDSQA